MMDMFLLDAMGGNGIYQYALDDSTLDSDISEFLAAGTYKYNITDQKGVSEAIR
jgi:hypothetical protein